MRDSIKSNGECQSQATGVIYKLTNTQGGKPYVGQTRQTLDRRIHGHRNCKVKRGVDAAIAKYGWENFTAEIIEVCLVEKLNERERFWIRELGTKAPNGYNLTDGGDGGRGLSYSPEARAKISAAHKGKPHSEEHKANIAAAKKAKKENLFRKNTREKFLSTIKQTGLNHQAMRAENILRKNSRKCLPPIKVSLHR